jgi:hypothetical protein
VKQQGPSESVQEIRLTIRGNTAKVIDLLPVLLEEEGLRLEHVTEHPVRPLRGMDAADVILTIVIGLGTAAAANYAQDKHITDKIDVVFTRLKTKATELLRWSSEKT